MAKVQLHAGLQAPIQRYFVDGDGALALVHRRRKMIRRVQMRTVVRDEFDAFDGPGFSVRQILRFQAGKEPGQFGYRGLVIHILDFRAVWFGIRHHVIFEKNGQIDDGPGHVQISVRSAPFSPSIVRASSGVAGSWPISARMRLIFWTCSAFDAASAPRSMNKLSSNPTLTCPPSSAACVRKGIWWRPAANTDHWKFCAPNRRSAVRFMNVRLSRSGPAPPSTPKTICTKNGGLTMPLSTKCARLYRCPKS